MRKLSRNDQCWCGSGQKYKKCHLASDLEAGVGNFENVTVPNGINIKTEKEIDGIRKSCQLTKKILDLVEKKIGPGLTTNDLNDFAHKHILTNGAIPAPLDYNGFPKSICTSLNNVVCHGIPDNTVIQNGDIINIDVTCILDGYFGDAGRMFMVGKPSDAARELVHVSYECLNLGIEQVKPFQDISVIGSAIEKYAKKHKFSVVRDYGGHGIGLKFHEEPHIHHYTGKSRGIPMIPNMVFTIEPMINAGRYGTRLLSDNWTAVTADRKLSAQWEHTVRVTETGVEVLTA